jgi:hypothetical protein
MAWGKNQLVENLSSKPEVLNSTPNTDQKFKKEEPSLLTWDSGQHGPAWNPVCFLEFTESSGRVKQGNSNPSSTHFLKNVLEFCFFHSLLTTSSFTKRNPNSSPF